MIMLAAWSLVFAVVPVIVYLRNRRVYVAPPGAELVDSPGVSILIPARNEEQSIGPAVESALASVGVTVEVIVLDDHSTDRTAEIVREIGLRDSRVRIECAPDLPAGWCGKQHACFVLSKLARYDLMIFVDADVRLAPDGAARMVAFQRQSRADLVSGVPRQLTGTILEKLLIPLIHFVLLCFLPMWRMRQSDRPEYGAGCGQLFLATRVGYEAAGGHASVRSSLHDGLQLPRAFRRAGRMTDLFDATTVATCRMYRSATQVWFGLAKNAHEGMASPRLLVPSTFLLLGGQVLPFVLLFVVDGPIALSIVILASALSFVPRLDAMIRFRQSLIGALLHPVGIVLFLAIQWYAAIRRLIGRPSAWKGRAYQG